MPLDAICISALTAELSQKLRGAKIDKVQQPARDLVLLSLRGEAQNCRLLLSCGTGSARAHLTEGGFENPQSPPMFCMLLRKHLTGSRILSVTQPDFERMTVFELGAYDELGEPVTKRLYAEMMGRSSNIILVGPEGHIIDCLRRTGGDDERRQLLPGLIYRMPPKQQKPCFPALSEEEISLLWESATGEKGADGWLLDSFSGLSPLVCREICFRATGETSKPVFLISQSERGAFLDELLTLRRRLDKGGLEPSMLILDGVPKDFSFMPISQYENAAENKSFTDFSSLLDEFYSARDRRELLRRKSQAMLKSVKSAHEREKRKLALRRQELVKAGERELFRKRGDLVTANLYRIKKGDRLLECEDYFEEETPIVQIPLDPLKTPQQNAAAFYREYNRAKTAESYLVGLIEKGERDEGYLASVVDEIERAENERDLDEIRRELTETGWVKAPKNTRKEKIRQSEPMKFLSSAGVEILVGKNNAQNDLLTFKIARKSDIWLHVQKLHGSHVIVSCKDSTVDEATLREAAGLAVYYSQARNGGKTAVDYTPVRNVKKQPGAMPGMVLYNEYKTLIAEPDATPVKG